MHRRKYLKGFAAALFLARNPTRDGLRAQQLPPAKQLSLSTFGGRADYSGTALYDGRDSLRVTSTDNTLPLQELIESAIRSGVATCYIPAGHWGITAGAVSIRGFSSLRIVGAGINATVLDFIKEDPSKPGKYVRDEDAHFIASFIDGESIEFSNLTIKATTKAGVVSGKKGVHDVYAGSVWGFEIADVGIVRLERVRVERFNYRGFSIHGQRTKHVLLLDCEGFYNTSTGYWVQDASLLEIIGGEFAYNGIVGEPGTGYGVTGSARVGHLVSRGAHYHHNYRKGLDTHGCGAFTAIGNTFEDNVIYHLAAPNWEPPASARDIVFHIEGNTFANGATGPARDFLSTCYKAIVENGYGDSILVHGGIVSVTDSTRTGGRQNKISRIEFYGNKILSHYNGFAFASFSGEAATYALEMWVKDGGTVAWDGNDIDLTGCAVPPRGKSDAATPVSVPFGSFELRNVTVKWLSSASFENTHYTTQTPASLTWASNKAQLTLNGPNNYQDNEIVSISGAQPAEYNGTFVLRKAGPNLFTYYLRRPGASAATGHIRCNVADKAIFLTTNGVNFVAEDCRFLFNDARFIGSVSNGRRSQATFTSKERRVSGCTFSYRLAPFESLDDAYFLGSQTSGRIFFARNELVNRSIRSNLPSPDLLRTDGVLSYRFAEVRKSAGAEVLLLFVDRADQQTLSIQASGEAGYLRLGIGTSMLNVVETPVQTPSLSLSRIDPFYDDAGVPRLAVVLKTNVAISSGMAGVITFAGPRAGLGVEHVVLL